MDADEVIRLRNILESVAESLKIEKLILDFTEWNQVFIDYNNHIRIAFWKSLENHGLKMVLLIIPPENFTASAQPSWESFYKSNKLNIEVSAISDRKLMLLFI